MAKKVQAYIKLQVKAGQANPSPPVGPALGQHGVNIMEFCKAFNAKTQTLEAGLPTPVVITVYADRSFTFITKTPPASILLKKAAGIKSGSETPHSKKVGKVTRAQLEEIANAKMEDLTAANMDAAVRTIAGSARSMGIDTEAVMAKLTKRKKLFSERVDPEKTYVFEDAIALLKELSSVKFTESVEVAINLGVDPRKSDQVVRSATVLPNGTGKTVRVAVFAQGANADKAKEAGADIVGFDDLAATIKGGELNFDVVIASPDAMRVVGQLGQILGPRGLMPNPKVGTVTPDVAGAVRNAKAGQVRYRTDKAGIIHCIIGKLDFDVDSLRGNLEALIADLLKAKPSSTKGIYVMKVAVSSTMGPGISIDKGCLPV